MYSARAGYADAEKDVKVTETKRPVVQRIAHREPESTPSEERKKPTGAPINVEIRGLHWVAGYYNRVSKRYTGDVGACWPASTGTALRRRRAAPAGDSLHWSLVTGHSSLATGSARLAIRV